MADLTPGDRFTVSARWMVDPQDTPIFSNQILVQAESFGDGGLDGAYLIFGHINPPVFNNAPGEVPTPEQVQSVIVPVTPVARIFVTKERLIEVRDKINDFLKTTGAEVASE